MPRPLTYTDDELASLTEGEREELLKAAAEGADGGNEDEDDTSDGDGEGEGPTVEGDTGAAAPDAAAAAATPTPGAADAQPAAAGDAGTDAAAAAEAAPAAAAPTAPPADRAPVPAFAPPADADAQLAALTEQRKALITQMDEGEISAAEYAAKLDDLTTQAAEIRDAQSKAAWSFEMSKSWWFQRTVPQFMVNHSEYSNPGLAEVLDRYVRDEQGKEGVADPFDPGVLDRAHARVQEFVRSIAPAAQPKPVTQQQTQQQTTVPPRPAPPPTLAHVPSATTAGDEEFAHMAVLMEKSPLAFEQALAKMTPEQQDRYLASVS